jgi:hypothetical protein
MGVIKYISSLIELLSIPCRVSYVPVLRDILLAASPYNWRLRQMIASQFRALVVLLPIQNLYATLFPLAITLIQDRIAEVRSSILPGIAKMITVVLPGYQPTYFLDEYAPDGTVISVQPPPISDDVTYLEAIVVAINALVVSDAFIYRQIWCELVVELLVELPPAIFEKYFLSGLLQLACDPITNVRVKVAESLTQWRKYDLPDPWEDDECTGAGELKEGDQNTPPHHPWRWLLSKEEVQECVQRLSRDDRDVFNRVKKLQPFFPEIEFLEISCRGMKASPGGAALVPRISFLPTVMTEGVEDMDLSSSLVDEKKSPTLEMETEEANFAPGDELTNGEQEEEGEDWNSPEPAADSPTAASRKIPTPTPDPLPIKAEAVPIVPEMLQEEAGSAPEDALEPILPPPNEDERPQNGHMTPLPLSDLSTSEESAVEKPLLPPPTAEVEDEEGEEMRSSLHS